MSSGREHRYESNDGLSLFYRDYRPDVSGTPVVCLPGLTRNSRDFVDLADYIGDRRRVIAPDFRGRGCSEYDPLWQNYHPGTYVQDTLTLLNRLELQRVIVIGTSLGGLCAMAMAAIDASRLAAVVMNDVGPEINPAGLERVMQYAGIMTQPESWQEALAQTKQAYGEWLPGLSDADWDRMVWKAYRRNDDGLPVLDYDSNIGRAIREQGGQTADPWAFFAALEPVPTTLLWGVNSDILSKDIVDRMQQRKPDLKVVAVAERGHAPLLNEPECLAAIDELLEQQA